MKKKTLGKAFAKYTKKLQSMGVDGIKLIEGKPVIRKALPIPDFDLPVWEPFWNYVEKTNFPILMHLNDPEEFWNKDKIPEFAKKAGWYYDETFINNEKQYAQMLNILKKHPNLKIIFAHFFFMSKQLDRLSNILDTYPNVMIDLTPGIEMYFNFQESINIVKHFFIKYQDRIVYGTDIGARAILEDKLFDSDECLARANLVQSFLEKDNIHIVSNTKFTYGLKDFDLKGLSLSKEVLKKIYFNNFVKLTGEIKYINNKEVIKEAKRLKRTIHFMSIFDKQVTKDYTNLNNAIKYFKHK